MKKIKLFLVLSLFTLNTVIAQNNDIKITDKKKDEKSKTLEDFIKSSKKIEGLFDIYQDTITGQVQMLIRQDQLNKDYYLWIANCRWNSKNSWISGTV